MLKSVSSVAFRVVKNSIYYKFNEIDTIKRNIPALFGCYNQICLFSTLNPLKYEKLNVKDIGEYLEKHVNNFKQADYEKVLNHLQPNAYPIYFHYTLSNPKIKNNDLLKIASQKLIPDSPSAIALFREYMSFPQQITTESSTYLCKLISKDRNQLSTLYQCLLSNKQIVPKSLYYPILMTTNHETQWSFIKQIIYEMNNEGVVLRPFEYQLIFQHIITVNNIPSDILIMLIKHIHSFSIFLDGDVYINIIQTLYKHKQYITCYILYIDFTKEKHFPISIKMFWIMDNIYKEIGENYTKIFPLIQSDGLSRIFEFALKCDRFDYILQLFRNSEIYPFNDLFNAIIRSNIIVTDDFLLKIKPLCNPNLFSSSNTIIQFINSITLPYQSNIGLFLYEICESFKIPIPANCILSLCQLLIKDKRYQISYDILVKVLDKETNLPRQFQQLYIQLSALIGNIDQAIKLLSENNIILTSNQYYELFLILYNYKKDKYNDEILKIYYTLSNNDLMNCHGLNGIAFLAAIPNKTEKKPDWSKFIELLSIFETKKYKLLLSQYKEIMNECSLRNRFDLCERLYNHIRLQRTYPLTILLESYVPAAINTKQSLNFIMNQLDFSLKYQVVVSDLLFSYFLKVTPNPVVVYKNVHNNKLIKMGSLSLDVLLKYYLKENEENKAIELFKSCIDNSLLCTILNYNTILEYYCDKNKVEEIKVLVNEIINRRIKVDENTIFYINNGLSKYKEEVIEINKKLIELMMD